MNFNVVASVWSIGFDTWKHHQHDQAMKKAQEHIEPHLRRLLLLSLYLYNNVNTLEYTSTMCNVLCTKCFWPIQREYSLTNSCHHQFPKGTIYNMI